MLAFLINPYAYYSTLNLQVDFEDDRGVEVDLRVELLDLEDEGRD